MNRRYAVTLLALAGLCSPFPADAQETAPAEFSNLKQVLRPEDKLIVTLADGTKITGRLVEFAPTHLNLRGTDSTHSIPSVDIVRIHRNRNGVILGAVIGAAAGAPFTFALMSWARNEGGSFNGVEFLPILGGLGVGIAIDAVLSVPRKVYERQPGIAVRPIVGLSPGVTSLGVSIRF